MWDSRTDSSALNDFTLLNVSKFLVYITMKIIAAAQENGHDFINVTTYLICPRNIDVVFKLS